MIPSGRIRVRCLWPICFVLVVASAEGWTAASSSVVIDGVVADRRYEDVSEVALPTTVGLVTFEFHAIGFETNPEEVVYWYRLLGFDKDWHITNARRVEYQDLPAGTYMFEVRLADQDLVYSDPATVKLMVHLHYERIGMWILGIVALLLCIVIVWRATRG